MSWQAEIRSRETAGPNYDVTTEEIISFLEVWAAQSDFAVGNVARDRLTLKFSRLPGDVEALARAIYELCPDTVDQNFGCIDETLEMYADSGQESPQDLQELVEGLDFDDPEYGLKAMARSLSRDRIIELWWD